MEDNEKQMKRTMTGALYFTHWYNTCVVMSTRDIVYRIYRDTMA